MHETSCLQRDELPAEKSYRGVPGSSLRGDLGDRSVADPGISLVKQPADLAQRNLGHTFALLLGSPLQRDGLE